MGHQGWGRLAFEAAMVKLQLTVVVWWVDLPIWGQDQGLMFGARMELVKQAKLKKLKNNTKNVDAENRICPSNALE